MASVLLTSSSHFAGKLLWRSGPRPKSSGTCFLSSTRQFSTSSTMQASTVLMGKHTPVGIDMSMVEQYASQATLLQDFYNIPSIDKAWIFKTDNADNSHAMFSIGQANLLANKRRTSILSSHISKSSDHSVNFQWSPFPVEMIGVSTVVPSPSGSKLAVVRNKESEPMQLEIWGPSQLLKEIHIPQCLHGSLYTDGWFEGISWNNEETQIAYVAEEPLPTKPVFDDLGFKKDGSSDKDCGSWKGQGEWEENWGETYSKKRRPSLFVVNIDSGEVKPVEGISKSLSVGQVVWAPSSSLGSHKYLVFVGWTAENGPQQASRKLGIKYCYNRPCALYAILAPFHKPSVDTKNEMEDPETAICLTHDLTSAFFPCFSPDGKSLVFLSAKSAVDTGAHWATNSLHRMDWPGDEKPLSSTIIHDVVPVVMCPEDGCFPGLYCSSFLPYPWLTDGNTMILSSAWGSTQIILSVNVLSCEVSRISPADSTYSWSVLALEGNNILALSSSPIDPPQVKYGCLRQKEQAVAWDWVDVPTPLPGFPQKVRSLLSSHNFSILKVPVINPSEELPRGAKKPIEAIFVSNIEAKLEDSGKESQKDCACNPLVLILHGGPHSVSLSSYSRSWAFLCSIGFNLLIVNYRGSLGFGEEALQSLPGKIGCQDVNDVLAALDYVTDKGLADGSKVAVLGGSHGGFLTTHLIGQAPDRFVAAAVRNPVCNLSLMVGTSDIPDWCYVEAFGSEGKNFFSEAPSTEHLSLFHSKSPISHLAKVKVPVLFLLGAQDLRVPVSNGLQYARALKEKGGVVKVIVFPDDVHALDRLQSDFESSLNIGIWFAKYCKL